MTQHAQTANPQLARTSKNVHSLKMAPRRGTTRSAESAAAMEHAVIVERQNVTRFQTELDRVLG